VLHPLHALHRRKEEEGSGSLPSTTYDMDDIDDMGVR
jgi:hypothetical protein